MPASLLVDTPEQQPVRLPLAGQGTRSLAFLIDAVIRYGASLLLFVIAQATADLTARARELHGSTLAAVTLAFFFAQWLYPVVFEALADGQTPGKKLFGLRVVGTDGRLPGLAAIASRNLLRVLDLLPGFYLFGQALILGTERRQRLGDLVARTVVVDERSRLGSDLEVGPWAEARLHQLEDELEQRRDRLTTEAQLRLEGWVERLNVARIETDASTTRPAVPSFEGRS